MSIISRDEDSKWNCRIDMEYCYGPPVCPIGSKIHEIVLESEYKLPNGHQELSNYKLFQQSAPPIGINNIKYINGILEPYERLQFFAQLLANEHRNRSGYAGPHPYLRFGDGVPFSLQYDEQGKLKCILGYNDPVEGSIFDIIAFLYGIDIFLEQVKHLAGALGLIFESLSSVSNHNKYNLWNGKVEYVECIPDRLNLLDVRKQNTEAILVNRAYIYGVHEEVLSSILLYEWDNNYFCIPASVQNLHANSDNRELSYLSIGREIAPALFINQSFFAKYPAAKVIFCQDIRLAITLDNILKSRDNYDAAEMFVTGIYGADLSKYNWERLHYRNIIFFPAPTSRSLAMVKVFKTFSNVSGEGSFKISNHFLLPYPMPANSVPNLSEAERHILSHSLTLSEVAPNMMDFLQECIINSMDLHEFTAKYTRLHVFKKNNSDEDTSQAQELTPVSIKLPDADPDWSLSSPDSLQDIKINHLFKPGNFIFLIGIKNSGKTYTANLLIKSVLQLESELPLFSSHSGRPFANVMLVDGESDANEIEEILKQHDLIHELDKRLFILHRHKENLPEALDNLSLTDPVARACITHELLRKQCRLLVLDNLTDLMGDTINYSSKAYEIIKWIKELQQEGICVMLCHHKSENKTHTDSIKTDGSQIFMKLARTIINVYGVKEIMATNITPQIVKEKAKADGLTTKIEFPVCQSAAILERIALCLHLPQNSKNYEFICATNNDNSIIEWPVGKNNNKNDMNLNTGQHNSAASVLSRETTQTTRVESTSSHISNGKKEKVYSVLLDLGGAVPISAILKQFTDANGTPEKGFGRDTIRSALESLILEGRVEKIGNTAQATRYRGKPIE